MPTRRTFLQTSSVAALATAGRTVLRVPRPVSLTHHPRTLPLGDVPPATDPQLKALALRALDAATAAGASYADVRFTVTRWRRFNADQPPIEREMFAMGVRALAKGSWGFAAHSDWTPDFTVQLGRQAAEQAKVCVWPHIPPIQLIDHQPAAVGNWNMPVARDPFTVPIEEVHHWIYQIAQPILSIHGHFACDLTFARQERTFASTEGAYTTQTVYTSLGKQPHRNIPPSVISFIKHEAIYNLPFVTPTGVGYEVLEEAKVMDHMDEWIETTKELDQAKPFVELGEYDVLFDGAAMAGIVDGTFGTALEYDRAVGYEANAGGTSYLAPPLKMLGKSQASTAVTITGDRTLPRGTATVGWDDEGVAPSPFPLVKDGVVVDYASSREFVSELAPWYHQRGVPVHSNGCSASESAFAVPMVYTPNLVLQPAAQDTSLETLLAGIDNGLLVCGGDVRMDFQGSSGRGQGDVVYAIKHGKRAGMVKEAVYNFRTQDLWKNLVALGGESTAVLRGLAASKGQPNQTTVHSIKAVAASFRKVQVVDAKHA